MAFVGSGGEILHFRRSRCSVRVRINVRSDTLHNLSRRRGRSRQRAAAAEAAHVSKISRAGLQEVRVSTTASGLSDGLVVGPLLALRRALFILPGVLARYLGTLEIPTRQRPGCGDHSCDVCHFRCSYVLT